MFNLPPRWALDEDAIYYIVIVFGRFAGCLLRRHQGRDRDVLVGQQGGDRDVLVREPRQLQASHCQLFVRHGSGCAEVAWT